MLSSNNVILRDREIPGRILVFRGTRVPFEGLVDCWQRAQAPDEFHDHFPAVTRQAAVQAVEHAKTLLVSELG